MRHASSGSAIKGACSWVVLVAVGLAVTAMVALHLIQPGLDPLAQPVSFYVWGRHGWLLPVALGAFGVALLAVTGAPADTRPGWTMQLLGISGALLLLTAFVPSDRWFPWERPPTASGLVHAAAAMLAPVLLVGPMISSGPPRDTRLRRTLPWIVGLFLAALIGSAASLAIGLWRDGPPPWIGVTERALAGAAVTWVYVLVRPARTDGRRSGLP